MSALAAPLLHRRGSLAVVGSDRPLILERRQVPEPCAHCGARSYSVCGAIEDADMGQLAALAVVTEVDGGRTFIEEGESAESFFNITSGTAKVYKLLPDGRRQITGFVGPGDFLGLAVSATYGFSAEAAGPVRFCRFSRPKLRKVLIDFPNLQQRLLELAAAELVAAQEQMLLLGRKTARERLASFLVMRLGRGPACAGEHDQITQHERITLSMTRSDIADYLGLTIETVSRTLSRLRVERMIDIPSITDLVILSRTALENLAGGLS